jgi:hypothetical protein
MSHVKHGVPVWHVRPPSEEKAAAAPGFLASEFITEEKDRRHVSSMQLP